MRYEVYIIRVNREKYNFPLLSKGETIMHKENVTALKPQDMEVVGIWLSVSVD